MSTATYASTQTVTISASDVRQVMRQLTTEITTICHHAAANNVFVNFDLDDALTDISILFLNDIILGAEVQFYIGHTLVREYAYQVSDDALPASGPSASQPPLGSYPAGTLVRLTLSPNTAVEQSVRDDWFERLGWHYGELLDRTDITATRYGVFANGNYALTRELLVNPRYDSGQW